MISNSNADNIGGNPNTRVTVGENGVIIDRLEYNKGAAKYGLCSSGRVENVENKLTTGWNWIFRPDDFGQHGYLFDKDRID